MRLYNYWRSTSSWRVRIALAFKDVDYDYEFVDLVEGEQHGEPFTAKNPMGQVPLLEFEEGGQTFHIGQSMAIMEYLEERYPSPRLLPANPIDRAHARQMAEAVNSGIHPLQNLAPKVYVRDEFGEDGEAWCRHWIEVGFDALEKMVDRFGGDFCVGDEPSFADICLVPQMYNARRYEVDLAPYENLRRVEENCVDLAPFEAAHPDQQPDAH